MPQVKGNATFLTNLRRQTPELERRVGIDNSDAHIENEAIEERKRKELEQIHLQQHRTLVERMYELTTTKKDCCNYQRMKSIAKETRVERIMDERRKEKEEIFKRITSKDGVNSNNKTTGSGRLMVTAAGMSSIRPQTVGGAPRLAQNGFSQIRIDDSESDSDDDYYGRRYAGLKSTTALKPRTTAHPSRSRRRPKTSHPARSIRQIRQALETEFSSVPKTRQRPKTTLRILRSGSGCRSSD
ncbi:hypothetical protein LSH36_696g01087 [Paralvinella palmiformis]|uniref:Uncharacterized protein n=1 Tax=Paralvinella palmiformis TaxID=53620 RepID=A0AAD9MTH2_9ANNE|nr:hypothetical protein LSH36_696g01087 [Paralvinella palmiformis]